MLSEEATNTNFIDFGLTRQGLEPTTYRTRCELANLYATDAVGNIIDIKLLLRKESLSRDDQQFHQYQQNEQLRGPLTLTH